MTKKEKILFSFVTNIIDDEKPKTLHILTRNDMSKLLKRIEKLDIKSLYITPNIEKASNENADLFIILDDIKSSEFSIATDFVRDPVQDKKLFFYHHIGIYGFTKNALNNFIKLKRSNLELRRNLEQMRALKNNIKIDVLYKN